MLYTNVMTAELSPLTLASNISREWMVDPHKFKYSHILKWENSTAMFQAWPYSLGVLYLLVSLTRHQEETTQRQWLCSPCPMGSSISAGAEEEVRMWLSEEESRKEEMSWQEKKGRKKSRLGFLRVKWKGICEAPWKQPYWENPLLHPSSSAALQDLGRKYILCVLDWPHNSGISGLVPTSLGVVWADRRGPGLIW